MGNYRSFLAPFLMVVLAAVSGGCDAPSAPDRTDDPVEYVIVAFGHAGEPIACWEAVAVPVTSIGGEGTFGFRVATGHMITIQDLPHAGAFVGEGTVEAAYRALGVTREACPARPGPPNAH